MRKIRQCWRHFFSDGPRPPEMAFLPVYFQLFLSAAQRVCRVCVFRLDCEHALIMFELYWWINAEVHAYCRFWLRAEGASQSVTRSIQNVRFAHVAQLALVEFFDLKLANYIERSSLVQEWRRRFGFFAFHLHSKKSPAWQVPNMAVFQSLENAHFGAAFHAVFRDDFTDLPETSRKGQHRHFQCAREDGTAFHCVFIKIEQKKSGKIACFGGAQNRPCGRCCATAVSSFLRLRPYKLHRMSTSSF